MFLFLCHDPKLFLKICYLKIKKYFVWKNFMKSLISKSSIYYGDLKLPIFSELGNNTEELKEIGILSDIFMQNYEREILEYYRQVLKEGDIVVDIGANLGITAAYALLCVKRKGTVYCFEPVNYLYKTLENFSRLNPGYNIKVQHEALADYIGKTEINVTKPPQIAGHTLSTEFANIQIILNKQPVNVITFDSFAINNNLIGKIKLVKMDVEGFELDVFRGMAKFLSSKSLPIILFEIVPSNISLRNQTAEDFKKILSDKYYFYNLQNLRREINLRDLKIRTNVVCLPKNFS